MQARRPVDLVRALALIHHLAISNIVPLVNVADYFADLGEYLIIEFMPKSDSQVKRLLASRVDIFSEDIKRGFEADFCQLFEIVEKISVTGSERSLYLMRQR